MWQAGAEGGHGGHSGPEGLPGGGGASPLSPGPGPGWPVLHLSEPQVRRPGQLLRQGSEDIRSAGSRGNITAGEFD